MQVMALGAKLASLLDPDSGHARARRVALGERVVAGVPKSSNQNAQRYTSQAVWRWPGQGPQGHTVGLNARLVSSQAPSCLVLLAHGVIRHNALLLSHFAHAGSLLINACLLHGGR